MVTNLGYQARRALPDCDLVNMFLSSKSERRFGVFPPDTVLHVAMGSSQIFEARSSSGPNVSLFQPDLICLGPNMKVSSKQI